MPVNLRLYKHFISNIWPNFFLHFELVTIPSGDAPIYGILGCFIHPYSEILVSVNISYIDWATGSFLTP